MRDSILIQKVKKGNQEAMHELIQEYYPLVYGYLYRKMLMDDRAKDLTQEVFIRFIRYIPTYHHEGKLSHYLYAIAGNVYKDHFKQVRFEDDIDDISYKLSDSLDACQLVLMKLQKEELINYIAKLNDDQQNVILLKYFHQLTFQEIATMYHKPLSTIKSRHTSALLKLKSIMERGDFL